VVDDSSVNRKVLANALSADGHNDVEVSGWADDAMRVDGEAAE
jgi:CheY-like chemotaxis protein